MKAAILTILAIIIALTLFYAVVFIGTSKNRNEMVKADNAMSPEDIDRLEKEVTAMLASDYSLEEIINHIARRTQND